jgi:hypothetical protein
MRHFGIAILTCISLQACDNEPFSSPSITPALDSLTPALLTAEADDVSVVLLTASLTHPTKQGPTAVVFTTTLGIFAATGTTSVPASVDTTGHAFAYLRAPRIPGVTRVSASYGTMVLSDTILFTRADPDTILVEASSFAVDSGPSHELLVSAVLRRSVGLPSPGIEVQFFAAPNTGSPTFGIPSLSDATGRASARFSPGNAPTGQIILTASALRNDSTIVSGHTSVQVVSP